jgi:hypothetical protein
MGGKAAVIVVVGFGLILGFVALNFHRLSNMTIGNMSQYNQNTASHNLAVAGANVGLAKFYEDTTWFGSITQSFTGTPFKGSFTVSMQNLGPKLRLRSVSSYPVNFFRTLNDTVEVYFHSTRENSFSIFAWMTEFEGNVFWITGDTVWGRVHSNGRLHVNGRPVFMEKVTTSKAFDPKPGVGTNKAIFKQGYETGVATIDFPDDFSEIVGAAMSGGRRYNSNVWIDLNPSSGANNDGLAIVRSAPNGPVIDTVFLNDPGFNGVILGDQRVSVKGTVDGKLTICSLNDVYILDDVLYATHPSTPGADDVLGLVAERNVVVADNAANNSNCVIQASVFARTGSFMAENFSSRPVSGELHLNGSIVQQTRGPVGTFSGSTIKSGFSKRYRYDTRLSDPSFRPPYYPGFYVKTYAISNWWESYRIPEVPY